MGKGRKKITGVEQSEGKREVRRHEENTMKEEMGETESRKEERKKSWVKSPPSKNNG